MTIPKIFVFILALLLTNSAKALVTAPDTAIKVSADSVALAERQARKTIKGVEVGIDVAGAVMGTLSKFGEYQLAARLNLRNTLFPTVELGMGRAHQKSKDTEIKYTTFSPYARIGMDYNFLRHDANSNRIYAGLRFAYSSYQFNLSAPPLVDPVYHTSQPISYNHVKGHQFWSELVIGIETRIWKFVRAGWDVRYKHRLGNSAPDLGSADYVPGYGRYGKHCYGGHFNLVFEF